MDRWVADRDSYRDVLRLDNTEWEGIEKLCAILKACQITLTYSDYTDLFIFAKVFTSVTYQMSKSTEPTLCWALPMYQLMYSHLISVVGDAKQSASIRNAGHVALLKLDKYYTMAKKNHLNIIDTGKCSTIFDLHSTD